MGRRWRRSNKQRNAQLISAKSSSSIHSGSSSSLPSTRYNTMNDRKVLLSYLEEFKAEAEACFSAKLEREKYVYKPKQHQPATLGDVTLPALSKKILERPFLALPCTLSSKQRKLVHETCVEVGLYHCSVGSVKDQRYIAVSIFADGFNSLDIDLLESENGSNTRPLYTFRPWFCRHPVHDNTPKKSNRNMGNQSQSTSPGHEAGAGVKPHALDLINDLIKHPGKCLRDGKDSIDFEAVDQQTLSSVALPALELNDSWILIDSPAKMKACIAELEAQPPLELAFDVECYNKSKYSQLTCLLQLCTDTGKTFVIDTLAPGVWEAVAGLAPVFADPSIVKVGHCIGGMDTFSLHRDFGIYVVNAFDTYEAAQVLKLPSRGLDSVCAHYGLQDSEKYFALKEAFQAGDWHLRPLTPAMLQYARYDVHFLLPLRKLMMRDLTRALLFDVKKEQGHGDG